jgi:phosphoribosylformylglycinamidine cyclo-ligase/phosphoribosylamine--glycine ligase/phosphoribosylformylglycinamidine cyclo-ligase
MTHKPGLVRTPLDALTYAINGLAMEVQHELRSGHREEMYQRRLADRARQAGYQVDFEKRVEVFINESYLGFLSLDLWIEQQLVVECKAHQHQLTNDEVGQVIAYVAATGSPVGMLYNFGRKKLEFKRILPPKNVQEWHSNLYRCITVTTGHTLPSLETISADNPLRFSVHSPFAISVPSSTSPSVPSSVPLRSSAPPSVDTSVSSSVPLRSSVPPSVDTSVSSSVPLRSSVPPSVDPSVSSSVPLRSSVPPSVDTSAYAASGVNITSGNYAVELMRDAVRATYGPEVLAGIGAFGGLFDASTLKGMDSPVLVASTDGVGTKVKLAAQAGRYESIGHDIVNHCLNDILVQGARPLFFLDYVASSKLDPEMVAEVVKGIAAACRAAGCALLGGETAEMPGVYAPDEFDVAGTIVGVVERAHILPRPDVQAGDALIGLRSSGPHTNGYSLIRKIFDGVPLDAIFPELGAPLGDVLLAPHRSYLPVISDQLSVSKALAHLTGGGFLENIPRVLPEGVGAKIHLGSWPVPPLFNLIQQRGEVDTEEMYRVFNMGIGMVIVAAPENVQALQANLSEEMFVIGELVIGEKKVTLT